LIILKFKLAFASWLATSLVRIIKYPSNSASLKHALMELIRSSNTISQQTRVIPVHNKVGPVAFGQAKTFLLRVRHNQLDSPVLAGRQKMLGQSQDPKAKAAGAHDENVAEALGCSNRLHDWARLEYTGTVSV